MGAHCVGDALWRSHWGCTLGSALCGERSLGGALRGDVLRGALLWGRTVCGWEARGGAPLPAGRTRRSRGRPPPLCRPQLPRCAPLDSLQRPKVSVCLQIHKLLEFQAPGRAEALDAPHFPRDPPSLPGRAPAPLQLPRPPHPNPPASAGPALRPPHPEPPPGATPCGLGLNLDSSREPEAGRGKGGAGGVKILGAVGTVLTALRVLAARLGAERLRPETRALPGRRACPVCPVRAQDSDNHGAKCQGAGRTPGPPRSPPKLASSPPSPAFFSSF